MYSAARRDLREEDRGGVKTAPPPVWLHPALIAAGAVFLIHFIPLAASIFDYRVTIDSAYHISIARQWGEHGPAAWDRINFGPAGRPNLQGPLFQAAIGGLGRMLGGSGRDYLMANAIASLAQWTAAIGTAAFFALELSGAWAALFAVSLLGGAAFAGSSFAAGIPSGWLFIFSGWAAWWFVRGKPVWAGLAGALAIYVHIAGFVMAPATILIAAIVTRRWRALVWTAIVAAILTAPYLIHVLRYLDWFSGAQGHSALLLDPMLDLLAAAGAAAVLRHPRRNAFLSAWLLGPLVWLAHDPGRLILQWGLAGSVAAGLMLSAVMSQLSSRRRALVFASAVVAIATLCPLGIPALAPEITWAMGLRYPRAIDWAQSRDLAAELARSGLQHTLVADYQPALCPAIAVFTPVSCEKGHWVEVQPRHDPADDLPAADKVYVLPMPADDPMMRAAARRGWIDRHGGVDSSTLITIAAHVPEQAAPWLAGIIRREAGWLAGNAVNNTIDLGNWRSVISMRAIHDRELKLRAQRISAGRIELACLLYAVSVHASDPGMARSLRTIARGFGVIASFLSDGFAIDYLSAARFAALKQSLSAIADAPNADPSALIGALNNSLARTLETRTGTFAERPPGDFLPWLSER